jgi:peptide/nickel transport system substrate-binding protein
MKLRKSFGLTIVVLALLLTACQSAVQKDVNAAAAENPTQESQAPVKGGVVRRALTSEPVSLDPHGVPSSGQNVLMPYLFDTLIFRDRDNNVHPYIAERWELSEEGKVITFYLRQDVHFTDGMPLNADAVVFTFNRFKEMGVKSPFYGSLQMIDSVEDVDEYTVRMTLVQPYSTIYSVLSSPYFGIISPTAVAKEGDDFGLNPVGSGAFKLESWDPGVSLALVRNEDYHWGPPVFGNQGAPYLERLEFPVIPDAASQMAALETGEIDLVFVNEPSTIVSLEQNPDVTVDDVIMNSLVYLGFNCAKPPFDEATVRRAIAMAVDKNQVLETALGGVGKVAFSPLSPSLPGFDPNLQDLELPYDLEASSAQLENAGFTQGEDGVWSRSAGANSEVSLDHLVLLTSTRAPNEEIAVVLQNNLQQLGITVEIQALDARAASAAASKGEYDLMLWRYDWSDSDVLNSYLNSSRIGSTNRNAYSNPQLDSLLESALQEVDDAARDKLYSDAQKLLMQDLPWLPLYVPRDVIAVRAQVKGVVVGSMGRILLNDAWVEGN